EPDESVQTCLYRGSRAIQFVTIKGKARLQPQGVACAKPTRYQSGGPTGIENGTKNVFSFNRRDEKLETVFAGVAGARSKALRARDPSFAEREPRQVWNRKIR